jgi:CubicO group peptidase (beta-lactamase class C family)
MIADDDHGRLTKQARFSTNRSHGVIQAFAAAMLIVLFCHVHAGDLPLDPATIEARKHKSDPTWNFLAYQHLDKLYDTRIVPAGKAPWSLGRAKRSLDEAFEFDVNGKPTKLGEFLIDTRVNAMLVLKDGAIVTEIYRHGSTADTRFISMSMSKSIISILSGLALQEGKLKSIDDPVVAYLPELKGTAYQDVTLRNLLTMRSGVRWNESGKELERQRALSLDEEQIYYEDYATQAQSVSKPGSTFNYSTLDAQVLGWALSRAVGRSVADYMSERLWKPAGMESSGYWVMQGPSGKQREFYGAGFSATLRDFGRLGQLMLNGGTANGAQVVPRSWVVESTSRGEPPKPYTYLWWGADEKTAYAALGFRGQMIYIEPSTNVVIVLLSYFSGQEQPDVHAPVLQAITDALSR